MILLWGKPLVLWLGLVLAILLTFQILSGARKIKVPFVWHRRNGYLMGVVALVHAFLGLSAWF